MGLIEHEIVVGPLLAALTDAPVIIKATSAYLEKARMDHNKPIPVSLMGVWMGNARVMGASETTVMIEVDK